MSPEMMSQPAYNDSVDSASIADRALEIGIGHHSYLCATHVRRLIWIGKYEV
jgi:hypothetical protein